jgi:RNA polymerase sigma factor (sigma-70 family)
LIEGLRNQDSATLKYLYKIYYPVVKNHVLKNSGDESDISEVLQESIIILYKQIASNNLDLATDLKGYFFGIIKLVWNPILRQKQRYAELVTDVSDESEEPYDTNDILLEKIVAKAMGKLKPECRQILNLFAEGHSFIEIAEIMKLKSEEYARRKKFLCKESLMGFIKADKEYRSHFE